MMKTLFVALIALLAPIVLSQPAYSAPRDGNSSVVHAGKSHEVQCRHVSAAEVKAEWTEPPALGRRFVASDFKAGNVAVVSHGFWQAAFEGKSAVIGAKFKVEDADFTIVGVAAKNSAAFSGAQVWLAARE